MSCRRKSTTDPARALTVGEALTLLFGRFSRG